MSKLNLAMSAAAACFAASAPAWAQQSQAPASPTPAASAPGAAAAQTAPGTSEEIVVRADAGDQVRIDRRVYAIHNDPIAQSTNMLDVLGRIPSVSVAPDSTVSLLGASNVTIEINNQPIPNQSQNLEQVLRSLQGSDVERIEVITNPSAQYSAQASGGIINIITKQRHNNGFTGAASATADSFGSYQANLSPTWVTGPWTLGTRLSYNVNRQSQDFERDRNDFTSALITHDDGHSSVDAHGWNGNLTGGYRPDARHRNTISYDGGGFSQEVRSTQDRTSAAGPVFDQRQLVDVEGDFNRLDFNYQQDGIPRELVKVDAAISRFTFAVDSRIALAPAVGPAPSPFLSHNGQDVDNANVTLDYERPFAGRQFLTTGLAFTQQNQDNDTAQHTLVGPPGPGDFESLLKARQQTLAGYATFQFGAGNWTFLPGLRAEDYRREVGRHGAETDTSDLRFLPSLHVRRTLTPGLDLDVSYSARINRPDPSSLDPAVRFSDATHANSGNPNLRPTTTDAFEANLNWQGHASVIALTFYDRINHDIVSPLLTQVGGVTLSMPVNAGSSEQRGLQAIMRGPISVHWRYSVQANFRNQAFDVLRHGVTTRESEFEYDGSTQLEWRDPNQSEIGADDVQFDLRFQGPRHSLQQKYEPSANFNVSWRRRLTDRLFTFVQAQDVFASNKTEYTTQADTFTEHFLGESPGARIRFSLTYQFGAQTDRPPNAPSESSTPGGAPQ